MSNEISKFDFYFREADGDDGDKVSVKVAPRENRGTDYNDDSTNVNVAPRANRGTDYNDDADTNDDENNNPADNDETTDQNAENDNTNNTDNNNDDTTDNNDDATNTTDDDTSVEPDTGDDGTDYNDEGDVDDGEVDDTPDDNNNADSDKERPKKYSLYLRYIKLYNMIDTFSDKIRGVVKDDASQNAVINKVVDNLHDLYDCMYEYMTIKFMDATYMETVIYFETVVNCVRLNFELLRNNKINLKQ